MTIDSVFDVETLVFADRFRFQEHEKLVAHGGVVWWFGVSAVFADYVVNLGIANG